MKQSEKPGSEIKIDDKEITVTVSRGKKIKVIELKGKSIKEVTKWIIKNHLKVKFEEKYDDSIKKNNIIGCDKKAGDIVTSGDTLKVYVSLGKLKMKDFKDLSSFYTWANKYNIPYEEEYEFSDKIAVGEIIKFSIKPGEIIKNGDVIKVIISNGNQIKMPDVEGLSKEKAISILKENNIKYNIVYRSSDSVAAGKVISQSIRSGSKISENTTVTITISKGKSTEKRENTSNSSSSNGNSGNSSSTTPSTPSTPTCNKCTITGVKVVVRENLSGGYSAVASALTSYIKSKCPGIRVNISGDDTSGKAPGTILSGNPEGEYTSCSTINITLAK